MSYDVYIVGDVSKSATYEIVPRVGDTLELTYEKYDPEMSRRNCEDYYHKAKGHFDVTQVVLSEGGSITVAVRERR